MPGLRERTEGLAWYHGLRHAITPALVISVLRAMSIVRVARTFPWRHSGGMNTRRLHTAPCTLSSALLAVDTASMRNLHNTCEKRSLHLCLNPIYNSNASFVSSFFDTLNSILMPSWIQARSRGCLGEGSTPAAWWSTLQLLTTVRMGHHLRARLACLYGVLS